MSRRECQVTSRVERSARQSIDPSAVTKCTCNAKCEFMAAVTARYGCRHTGMKAPSNHNLVACIRPQVHLQGGSRSVCRRTTRLRWGHVPLIKTRSVHLGRHAVDTGDFLILVGGSGAVDRADGLLPSTIRFWCVCVRQRRACLSGRVYSLSKREGVPLLEARLAIY